MKLRHPFKNTIKNQVFYEALVSNEIDIEEMAEALDISSRTIRRWVYEDYYPPINLAKVIAETLNIPLVVLFPIVMRNIVTR